jgi:hypothetical protein
VPRTTADSEHQPHQDADADCEQDAAERMVLDPCFDPRSGTFHGIIEALVQLVSVTPKQCIRFRNRIHRDDPPL